MPQRHPVGSHALRLLHRPGSARPAGLALDPLARIDVLHLFPEERSALLDALRSLSEAQWAMPTVCAGWSVKDIAQHLLADDLGRLSHERDGYNAGRFQPTASADFDAQLLVFINRQNERWVESTRRLSPRILIDLLEWGGGETQAYFESLDLDEMGLGVSWAGEAESPHWFDLAREYTERWHHQAQIREGAGLPLLDEPRLFAPVLETFVRALPHTLRDVDAPDGTTVTVTIAGEAGGSWSAVRGSSRWQLTSPVSRPAASLELDQGTAWRLFTKGLTPAEARPRATLTGDEGLADRLLQMVSIIA